MAEYFYKGVKKNGETVEGRIDAPSEGELRMILRGQGIRPTKIAKVGVLNADIGSILGGGGSVPSEDLVAFTRQFHVLISSGVPLVQSIEVLGEQAGNKTLKSILGAIKEKVSGGMFFWEAISSYPKAFPKMYIALIRAGESSGAMDAMLKRLSRYLEDAERLRKMLKSAMMYPIAVISVSIGVITLMLTFVIPKFEELLKGSGQDLPAVTQLVIRISHFFQANFLYLLAGVGAGIYLFNQYRQMPEGRRVIDRAVFNLPLFGEIAQKGGVARFARTMGTLLSSGVNLLDAIDICRATIGNAVLEDAVSSIRKEVEAGKSLGSVVSKIKVFPRMAVQMVSVGESTGALDKMLDKLADFYEMEVENLVGGISKLIEPFILVFLGGVVGGLMIAMYMPIFKMADASGP